MGQATDEAEGDQAAERGGKRRGQVAKGIERHQQEQHVLAQQLGAKNRQGRRTDHHAQGVGADRVADLGLAQVQVMGDIRHQPHDGEFAGANGETPQRHGSFHFGNRAF